MAQKKYFANWQLYLYLTANKELYLNTVFLQKEHYN